MTWIQQETVEMPQLQSIDEVVEVPGPREDPLGSAHERGALGDGEGTADRREHRDGRRGAETIDVQDVDKWLWIPSDGMEPDSTERDDDVATNEAN